MLSKQQQAARIASINHNTAIRRLSTMLIVCIVSRPTVPTVCSCTVLLSFFSRMDPPPNNTSECTHAAWRLPFTLALFLTRHRPHPSLNKHRFPPTTPAAASTFVPFTAVSTDHQSIDASSLPAGEQIMTHHVTSRDARCRVNRRRSRPPGRADALRCGESCFTNVSPGETHAINSQSCSPLSLVHPRPIRYSSRQQKYNHNECQYCTAWSIIVLSRTYHTLPYSAALPCYYTSRHVTQFGAQRSFLCLRTTVDT